MPIPSLRRFLIASLAGLPLAAVAAATRFDRLPRAAQWIVGSWRSDAERTMRSFAFQGTVPSRETYARTSALFGSLTHTFTQERLIVTDHRIGQKTLEAAYRRVEVTSNTISIGFAGARHIPNMTLYRDGDHYFIRAGSNFEFFRRVSA